MSEACSVNGMMPHLENKWRTDSSFMKVALQDRGNILNVKSKALIIEMKNRSIKRVLLLVKEPSV